MGDILLMDKLLDPWNVYIIIELICISIQSVY